MKRVRSTNDTRAARFERRTRAKLAATPQQPPPAQPFGAEGASDNEMGTQSDSSSSSSPTSSSSTSTLSTRTTRESLPTTLPPSVVSATGGAVVVALPRRDALSLLPQQPCYCCTQQALARASTLGTSGNVLQLLQSMDSLRAVLAAAAARPLGAGMRLPVCARHDDRVNMAMQPSRLWSVFAYLPVVSFAQISAVCSTWDIACGARSGCSTLWQELFLRVCGAERARRFAPVAGSAAANDESKRWCRSINWRARLYKHRPLGVLQLIANTRRSSQDTPVNVQSPDPAFDILMRRPPPTWGGVVPSSSSCSSSSAAATASSEGEVDGAAPTAYPSIAPTAAPVPPLPPPLDTLALVVATAAANVGLPHAAAPAPPPPPPQEIQTTTYAGAPAPAAHESLAQIRMAVAPAAAANTYRGSRTHRRRAAPAYTAAKNKALPWLRVFAGDRICIGRKPVPTIYGAHGVDGGSKAVSANLIRVHDVRVSKRHCELRANEDGTIVLFDHSSNGTCINGRPVPSYQEPSTAGLDGRSATETDPATRIVDGVTISLGQTQRICVEFKFHAHRTAPYGALQPVPPETVSAHSFAAVRASKREQRARLNAAGGGGGGRAVGGGRGNRNNRNNRNGNRRRQHRRRRLAAVRRGRANAANPPILTILARLGAAARRAAANGEVAALPLPVLNRQRQIANVEVALPPPPRPHPRPGGSGDPREGRDL